MSKYFLAFLLWLLLLGIAFAQQPPTPTCKDNPVRCDKELVLLKGEVDQKRATIAALWEQNEQLQQRAEKAEARLKELQLQEPVKPEKEP